MTRRGRRIWAVLGGLAILGGAAALVLAALEDSIVFFYSPTEMAGKEIAPGREVRIGGLVEADSLVVNDAAPRYRFRVTDLAHAQDVVYDGLLPDLFREGQGVVVAGQLDGRGLFVAREVLAKHDERYMPPEVADALKKSGQWQGQDPP